jgi:hypothetical protein
MKVLSFRTAAFAAALPVYFLLHLKQFLHVVINTSSITFGYASTSAPIQINSTDIETVLIIATVPYSANHVMALWTQLECVTDGIDRVLISAPDASWSKEIIAHVIKRFTQLSNSTAFRLEAAFNLNNRYDVGLWCDGIDYIKAQNTWVTSTDVPRAVFLINDSAAALRRYDELTNRVVAATQIEQRNRTDTAGGSVKLISLNGDLIVPRRHKTWVESVYRGLTPNGASIFYQHSCTSENQRACVGKRGGINKDCIVMHYEQALARSYLPAELETMFPSYFFPESWNTSIWETTNGPIRRREHWLQGKQFFWFLYEVHNFPFRKLKWPDGPPPPESQCLELLGGKPQFDELPYPSDDTLKDYQAEMLDLDWLL